MHAFCSKILVNFAQNSYQILIKFLIPIARFGASNAIVTHLVTKQQEAAGVRIAHEPGWKM